MENRKRNIQLKIWVSPEEKDLIHKKMLQIPTNQLGAYIRKMAIDGYIINTDMTAIKQYTQELQRIGNNINQIARRVNATNTAYGEDIAEIRARIHEIWQLQRRILLSLR